MRKKKRSKKVTKSDIYSGLFLNSSIFKGKYLYELQRGINGSASLLCSFAAFLAIILLIGMSLRVHKVAVEFISSNIS